MRVGRLTVTAISLGTTLLLSAPIASAQPPEIPQPIIESIGPAVEVGPGITHREMTTDLGVGRVMADVVEVDLADPAVRVDLLWPGAVAARAPVKGMADRIGAVAGINGDFFDIGRTNAPAGPAVLAGRPLKGSVPQGRRAAPPVPGAETDYVFALDATGVARVDRVPLRGQVTRKGVQLVTSGAEEPPPLPIVALNQHAVPQNGIGVFTSDWGDADRARTLCGSDVDRDARCAIDQIEIAVRDGRVAEIRPPRGGAIPPAETVVVGRDMGAVFLRSLAVGDEVSVDYRLEPESGVAPFMAVGGSPILRDTRPVDQLDDTARAPRSGVGVTPDGRRMFLVTVDGRQSDSVGATLLQFGRLLGELGLDDAVNLDGGGSSTLAYRAPGTPATTIVNDPSDPSPRLVPNGIGVWTV
jgi:hypothetical protein